MVSTHAGLFTVYVLMAYGFLSDIHKLASPTGMLVVTHTEHKSHMFSVLVRICYLNLRVL